MYKCILIATDGSDLSDKAVDSGLAFEREASYFGRGFVQTLEPRAFYTYTPYRDQSRLPL